MDQVICASIPHTHCWYEVGMLKVPAVYVNDYKMYTHRGTCYTSDQSLKSAEGLTDTFGVGLTATREALMLINWHCISVCVVESECEILVCVVECPANKLAISSSILKAQRPHLAFFMNE